MKMYLLWPFSLCMLTVTYSCNGQTDAQKEAKKIAADIKKTMGKPDMVAVSANGYYMKATIDGKLWEAAFMYPTDKPNGASMIAGESGTYLEKGGVLIGIHVKPVKRWLEVGKKYKFGEARAVDFAIDEDTYGGYVGELTITKVDDKWVEGTFYFTATSSSASGKHEITNGSFRVAVTKE
jgi:Family of unknown function (DUF6252)